MCCGHLFYIVCSDVPRTILQWGFRLLGSCGILAFLYVLLLPMIGAAKKNPEGL